MSHSIRRVWFGPSKGLSWQSIVMFSESLEDQYHFKLTLYNNKIQKSNPYELSVAEETVQFDGLEFFK